MNPFLHPTAGRPAPDAQTQPDLPAGRPPAQAVCGLVRPGGAGRHPVPALPAPGRRLLRRPGGPRRLSHLLAAGIAALAWAGVAGAVDVNSATMEQLRAIRGIGPKTAQIILDERARGGRYQSFSDLSDRVRGIGPRRAQALQSAGLTIGGGAPPASGVAPRGSAPDRPAGAARPGARGQR